MNGNSTIQNHILPWRMALFTLIVGLVFVIYVGRLFNLQIIEYSSWLAQSDDNRTNTVNLATLRGIIYDRNGMVLARNIPSYNIVITAAALPDDVSEKQAIYRDLSAVIGIPVSQGEITEETPFSPCKSEHGIIQAALYGETSTPYQPVRVACDVPRTVAMIVQEKTGDWPGIGVEIVPIRDYPTGVYTANIIGYLGPISAANEQYYRDLNFLPNRDSVGYAGVEREFQTLLGGVNGLRVVEIDAGGQVLRDLEEPVPPEPGKNIRLTIDYRLQEAAYNILVDVINSYNRVVQFENKKMTSGVVIAINPKTGEILAMVSYPSYENNRLARIIPAYYYEQLTQDATVPLLNHAVGDELPVGSVFKLVTVTGALNEQVVTLDQIVKTPGQIFLTERYYTNDPGTDKSFVDWIYKDGLNPAGFGQLDILHCIAFSSNVCFYKLGGGYQDEIPEGLGICRLGTYARALGYGSLPGIELPDTADGLIPDPTWKRINQGQSWSAGDTYIASVGQGFIIGTPLQVLLSAATIANDGKLMEPTILREVIDEDGSVIQSFEPNMRWDLTVDPVIDVYDDTSIRDCEVTGEKKTIEPWVFASVREGMRLAATEGTLSTRDIVGSDAARFDTLRIAVAGKTGTAEYCDKYATVKGLCIPGKWPTHAWTVAFAPFEAPEIAVVAFVYNGGEGASVAGPIVRRVLEAYFELKAVDVELSAP